MSKALREDVKSLTVDLDLFPLYSGKTFNIENDQDLNTFQEVMHNYSSSRVHRATYTLKTPSRPKRRKRKNTESTELEASKNKLKHRKGMKYYCTQCCKELTFDDPGKVTRHCITILHSHKFPSLIMPFIRTFEFVDLIPQYFRAGKGIRVRTTKSPNELLTAFRVFCKDNSLTLRQFILLLKKHNIVFKKVDGFFCLCPICQNPQEKPTIAELTKHVEQVQKRWASFKEDLLNKEMLVCVMDFASNPRSKRTHMTQIEGFSYDQWTFFNLTVLKTDSKENVDKYFDVLTYHSKNEERISKYNSDYVLEALKKIFKNPFFKSKRGKNLVIWMDNGKSLKSTKVLRYLASLSGTQFSSVSPKYFFQYHGKGICDRHFGKASWLRRRSGGNITTTEDLKEVHQRMKKLYLLR